MSRWRIPFAVEAFEAQGDLVITDAGSIDGAQGSGRWVRGKPVEVKQ